MKLKPFLIALLANTALMILAGILISRANVSGYSFLIVPLFSVTFSIIAISNQNPKGKYYLWGTLCALPLTFLICFIAMLFSGIQC
ncbi:hypothetical protein C8P68_101258 [Mucilaginibacter yixingensis]|uniref:Uncharacterized protein n=1 Tax=Mucilaginibacter yixingensis TaxID=1295612 RepID=A0A2T5JF16_9SPHI|nr:hypothetical protein [Mucilaginibacter yixingensis]PTR01028.1 hypothetical protein C8P68_101258 [Mucilaginibacter yixingensis]